MVIAKYVVALTGLLLLGGCNSPDATTFALYRNSPFEAGARIHWGTFDAKETDPSYNKNNCEMAARLLNANVAASAKVERKEVDNTIGFWCEIGKYKEQGANPSHFEAQFSTDVY